MNQYNIFPLGDAAATIDLGNVVDEQVNLKTIALRDWLMLNPFSGLKEVIMGLSAVTVFYDVATIKKDHPSFPVAFQFVQNILETAYAASGMKAEIEKEIMNIPVCYHEDFGTDLRFVSENKNISIEEIIELHTSEVYRVYMIGFLPGFSYLGRVNEKIALSRKPIPESVEAGSVGIAGTQTGIYPLNSPGGWHIIGRSPFLIFDPGKEVPVKMSVGDRVKFFSISKEEMVSQ